MPHVFDRLPASVKDLYSHDQIAHEMDSVDWGVERYRLGVTENSGKLDRVLGVKAHGHLITRCMPAVVAAIQAEQDKLKKLDFKHNANKHMMYLLAIPANKLAVIAMTVMMHAMTSAAAMKTATAVAIAIAKVVKTERQLSRLRKDAPDLIKLVEAQSKKMNARAIKNASRRLGLIDDRWSKNTSITVGSILIDIVVKNTVFFEKSYGEAVFVDPDDDVATKSRTSKGKGRKQSGGRKKLPWGNSKSRNRNAWARSLMIGLTDEGTKALRSLHSNLELMLPTTMPMVSPPIPRSPDGSGGFVRIETGLIKDRSMANNHGLTEIPDVVYRVVNCIQNTEWRINKENLRVQQLLWDHGGNTAGLPHADKIKSPPKPKKFNAEAKRGKRWAKVPPEEVTAWRTEAAKVHDQNAEEISQRCAAEFRLKVAHRMSKYPCLYFPHNLCYRGRAYALASHLHRQAPDVGSGLLELARGKRLGKYGFRWLVRVLASLLGFGKESFETGEAAVLSFSSNALRGWVKDPLTNTEWADTNKYDEPFALLAAVREYFRVIDHVGVPPTLGTLTNYGADFVSHMPGGIDGTCNGLQHYSALGRDRIGALATNILKVDKPNDIYRQVQAAVIERINKDCAMVRKSNPKAKPEDHPCLAWENRVTRDHVKRGTMTTPYGVTQRGMHQQILSGKFTREIDGSEYTNANYLKDVLYEAIGVVVVSARQNMDWIRKVAEILGKEGRALTWKTPAGFRVHQEYLIHVESRVPTVLGRLKILLPRKDMTVDVKGQVRGSAPNTIHSFDASHLYLLGDRMLDLLGEDEFSLGPNHDCFDTHLADMQLLYEQAPIVLAEMYAKDHFADIKKDLEERYGIELPPLPKRGDVDPEEIKKANYAFRP